MTIILNGITTLNFFKYGKLSQSLRKKDIYKLTTILKLKIW